MKITQSTSRALLATILALGFAACRNTAEGVKKDAKESADKAAEAVKDAAAKTADAAAKAADAAASVAADAAQSASDAGAAAVQGAKEMSQAAADASKQAGAAVAAATNTADVKAAFLADKGIDASRINVDTDAKTRTVVLKGSVPSAEQKSLAEKVATSKSSGYKVVNQLEVVKK